MMTYKRTYINNKEALILKGETGIVEITYGYEKIYDKKGRPTDEIVTNDLEAVIESYKKLGYEEAENQYTGVAEAMVSGAKVDLPIK